MHLCYSAYIIIFTFYSFSFFHKFLNLFPFRWYILHTFMDTFQGCYKDGTEPGTRDCRWCVSAYFIFRLTLFVLFSQSDHVIFLALSILAIVLYSTLLATVQPFKPSVAYYNEVYIIFSLYSPSQQLWSASRCLCHLSMFPFSPYLQLSLVHFHSAMHLP